MKLIITDDYTNKILLTPITLIEEDKHYILNNIDTKIIEYFYIEDRDLYITSTNIEYLYTKINRFKYINVVQEYSLKDNLYKKYERVEKSLSKKVSERGLEISFKSDVYKSVFTSLTKPEIYLSEDNVYTRIIKYVYEKGSVSYDEILNIKIDVKSLDKCINSLVYTGVLIKNKDKYEINEILLV
ncbi:hypothetical protein P3W45_000645 [Vairimorpha bombi]|jgi:hypothetical protein